MSVIVVFLRPLGLRLAQTSTAKTVGAVSFDFINKKDPFKPYLAPAPVPLPGAAAQRTSKTSGQLPIQSYDVSKFKVSAIIAGLKDNRALVIDPTGKGYVVKQGMAIGNNNGTITKITPTYLEVTETYREDNGKTRQRNIKLTLVHKR